MSRASSTTTPALSKRACSSRTSALHHDVGAREQRRLAVHDRVAFVLVVGERRSEMAHRRLRLQLHVVLVVVDVEKRLGRVVDAPDDDGSDLDRVAALVVDLEPLAVQVARASEIFLRV